MIYSNKPQKAPLNKFKKTNVQKRTSISTTATIEKLCNYFARYLTMIHT